jgi:hypothetical protein
MLLPECANLCSQSLLLETLAASGFQKGCNSCFRASKMTQVCLDLCWFLVAMQTVLCGFKPSRTHWSIWDQPPAGAVPHTCTSPVAARTAGSAA